MCGLSLTRAQPCTRPLAQACAGIGPYHLSETWALNHSHPLCIIIPAQTNVKASDDQTRNSWANATRSNHTQKFVCIYEHLYPVTGLVSVKNPQNTLWTTFTGTISLVVTRANWPLGLARGEQLHKFSPLTWLAPVTLPAPFFFFHICGSNLLKHINTDPASSWLLPTHITWLTSSRRRRLSPQK